MTERQLRRGDNSMKRWHEEQWKRGLRIKMQRIADARNERGHYVYAEVDVIALAQTLAEILEGGK